MLQPLDVHAIERDLLEQIEAATRRQTAEPLAPMPDPEGTADLETLQ
jgi:hypothetical protein